MKDKYGKKKKKRNDYEEGDLSVHLDDNIRVAATNVTNGEINTALDANSEESKQILH